MVNTLHIGTVAVLSLNHPPVNALSIRAGVVDGLERAIRAALGAPSVRAIVMTAEGGCFCAGADVAEFGAPPEIFDRLRTLMTDLLEAATKPVVMAINGLALGGGLELALCGHYRICATGARFGLPEVTLGLIPGSGGTQRLPALVGIERALAWMQSGATIDAHAALQAGLVDRIASGDLLEEATTWARALATEPIVRTGRPLPSPQDTNALARAGERAARPALNRAPAAIVQCLEASLEQTRDAALALERRLFGELLGSPAARGLRHVFFGRREVARIPGIAATPEPAPIRRVAVVGGGLMGTGITIALVNAGYPVTLVEIRPEALERALESIRRTIDRDRDKGRISAETAAQRIAAVQPTRELGAAAGADLVIEAVFEGLDAKRAVFERLDACMAPGTIMASNTSTLDLDAIARCTGRPQDVIGLHFFSPANIMKLVEVVRGAATAPEVLRRSMAFVKSLGKVGVVAGVCDGFIGNRVFEEYLRQAYFLLEEGALPAQIDAALERWGMAMGPLRVMDLAGQDIGWSIRKRRALEQPHRPYSRLPDLICELGRFGQKTGAGFYRYADGRTASVDPQVDDLIVAFSQQCGIVRRQIPDEEIVDRCILALVNEGAHVLADGIAYRPVDVDMTFVFGYGFPAERGGPMFYAEEIGWGPVADRMRDFSAGPHGWAWKPAPRVLALASGAVPPPYA